MIQTGNTFSSFSVDDTEKAREFYDKKLGVRTTSVKGMEEYGLFEIHIPNGNRVMVYPKENHEPATFTVLNFPVEDIDKAVDELMGKGIEFEHYDDKEFNMDDKGISRSTGAEPNVAWFKDPAGNILSIIEENQ